VPAWLLCLVLEKLGALRVSIDAELVGLDMTQWETHCQGDDLQPPAFRAPSSGTALASQSDDLRPDHQAPAI
jgi:hypothetical protein